MTTFTYRHNDQTELELVNGHYELGEAVRTSIDGHDILYSLGSALLDNSCCGSFGCAYALVIGEPLPGQTGKDNLVVRQIDAEGALAERIRTELLGREAINVVNFYIPPQSATTGGSQ